MIKITFWLKKSDTDQGNLEYITIANPKVAKVENDTWESRYICDVYLSDIKYNYPAIYGTNPIDTLQFALELVKVYLQGFTDKNYIILDGESRQPWKLEKGKTLSERISEIKNNKTFSVEDKKKTLGIMKEMANNHPHQSIKDEINKAIDEN